MALPNQYVNFMSAGMVGQLDDQSLANKFYGYLSAEETVPAGIAFVDSSVTTYNNKPSTNNVFQSYKAGYQFAQNMIAGLIVQNNSMSQPIRFSTNTPQNAIIPIAVNTQFSVIPLNQLFRTILPVLAGEASGGIKQGQLLYKKVPTANDTFLDRITLYAFNNGTTQDLTNFIYVQMTVQEIGLPINTTIYGATTICKVQTTGIIPIVPPVNFGNFVRNNKNKNAEVKPVDPVEPSNLPVDADSVPTTEPITPNEEQK